MPEPAGQIPALALANIEKRYGDTYAVASISLDVQPGEFVTLLGPSGCGKTTTLNMIAGFIQPDAGHIALAGRPIENLPPHRRDLGIVFQDYALFPHRTVAENVAFGLRMRKVAKADIARRVAEALQMVRLEGLADRRPQQLSGGQRQRVALARALVIRPALLLLDEPLSNLDLKLREEMRIEISALQRRLGIATVFVTHDQDEALTMSDRIAVLRQGRIEQLGTAREIYEHPASAFVATFIGTMNLLRAETAGPADGTGLLRLRTPAGDALAARGGATVANGAPMHLTIRPERLRVGPPGGAPAGATAWSATVDRVIYLGSRVELQLRIGEGVPLIAELVSDGGKAWQAGEAVEAWFRPEDTWIIPA